MTREHLPSRWVVVKAREYLRTAPHIEQHAHNGNTGLFWPATMNDGLASELYLNSCLVESDPDHSGDIDDPGGIWNW